MNRIETIAMTARMTPLDVASPVGPMLCVGDALGAAAAAVRAAFNEAVCNGAVTVRGDAGFDVGFLPTDPEPNVTGVPLGQFSVTELVAVLS
jgi:hypothetical protein